MIPKYAQPGEWLTDGGLTDQGRQARRTYAKFVDGLMDLPVSTYRVSRALHLLQSNYYDTSADGFALPPHTINFCVNNVCNFKCSYCDLNHGRQEWDHLNTKMKHNVIDPKVRHELPLDLCKRIIDEVAWFRPTIRIPWMEPLLYRNLIPFIEYTKSKDLQFSMLTNGLLLPKYARQLVDAGVDALRVSLDGPEAVHEELCGVKGAYAKIIEGLKILVEERKKRGIDLQIGCYFTVNDKNCDQLVPMLESLDEAGLLEEMFVGFFMFNYISKDMVEAHNTHHAAVCGATVEETSAQYIDISKIDVDSLLRQRREIEERFAHRTRIHFRPDFTESNLRFCVSDAAGEFPGSRCETQWHTLFINPDGEIKSLPQCILDPVGNVHEDTFLDIWNGEKMREQRKLLRQYGAYYGCMRCWSIYNNIEDLQGSWKSFPATGTED